MTGWPDRAPGHAFGFPVFLEVRGRPVLVAGGGPEAADKAGTLAGLGARVRLWAPDHDATRRLAGRPSVELRTGPFEAGLLDGAVLAIVATGDRALDRTIATEARARGVLVNTVDDVPFCDFSLPAVLRRGELTVAIATGGVAPVLAVRLRDRLAAELGDEYAELLELLAELRPRIAAAGRPFADRRRLWYALVDGPALDALRAGRAADARAAVEASVRAWLARGGVT